MQQEDKHCAVVAASKVPTESSPSGQCDQIAARRIIRRCLRNFMMARRFRVEVKSLRFLHRAFQNAAQRSTNRDHHHKARQAYLPEDDKRKRVVEFERRTSKRHVATSASLNLDVSNDDPEKEGDESSSCDDRVSVETVVHNLFLQMEELRRQSGAKDQRIGELEALVASLTLENEHLRAAQQLCDEKTLSLAGSPIIDLDTAECLENEVSNQIVME